MLKNFLIFRKTSMMSEQVARMELAPQKVSYIYKNSQGRLMGFIHHMDEKLIVRSISTDLRLYDEVIEAIKKAFPADFSN